MRLIGRRRQKDSEITVRRAAERTVFSDAEIKDGFFKTALHAELQFDQKADRIRKFDGPVRVFVVSHGAPDRRAEIAAIVGDIRARVAHLDVALTDNRNAANFVVTLVPQRELASTIRAHLRRRAGQTHPNGARAGMPLRHRQGRESFRIRRAEAILPVDAADFTFYDCAYEELLQGLGIINDDNSVPWTMFNDDVQIGILRHVRSAPHQYSL